MVEEVEDEQLFAERVAGIDIGKTAVIVTIRVPGGIRRGRRRQETPEFRAVRKDLLALASSPRTLPARTPLTSKTSPATFTRPAE